MTLKINSTELSLAKAYNTPKYDSKRVLTRHPFTYVELWLRSQPKERTSYARFFWKQAQTFYEVSNGLPMESKPLVAYYCLMNAAKSLISLRKNNDPLINIAHGVTSKRSCYQKDLNAEIILKGSGVLAELATCIGDSNCKEVFKVLDLLRNLPAIHRTYSTTHPNSAELFIPIHDIKFEQTKQTREAYISFSIDEAYSHGGTLKRIPSVFQRTNDDRIIYRTKKRFKWDIHTPITKRLNALCNYHTNIRKHFFYIKGYETSWYIKKEGLLGTVDRTPLIITYAIMHWLSELVRYNPEFLHKLLSGKYNWLVTEFVETCFSQFIDEICCEITGENIGYGKWQ